MALFLTLFSFLIVIFLLVKFEIGVGAFLLFSLTIPIYVLYFGGITLGWNLFQYIILVLCLLKYKGRYAMRNLYVLSPFIFLYFAQFFFIPFHSSRESITDQLMWFRMDMTNLVIPFVILNVSSNAPLKRNLYNRLMCCVIAIVVVYGLSLFFNPGRNLYLDSLFSVVKFEQKDLSFALDEGVRVFGYVSSCFGSTTQLASFLSFAFVFLSARLMMEKKGLFLFFSMGGVIALAMFCGTRSVLIAMVLTTAYYCLLKKEFKIFAIVAIVVTILYLLISLYLPEYFQYVESVSSSDVTGSSIEMRLDQLKGCFNEIKDNQFFGNGYGYTKWYLQEVGRHPICLSFESIFFSIICNNGVVGIIIWIIFIFIYHRVIKKLFGNHTDHYIVLSTLLFAFFGFTLFTGDFSSSGHLLVFYAILMSVLLYRNNEKITSRIDENESKSNCDVSTPISSV